jgi:hypothetical protein
MKWRCLVLIAGFLVALLVPNNPAVAQVGFDRPGGDFASFPMRAADPAQCAARCERDTRCRAWAFSYPATDSIGAEPRSATTEFGIDRFGGDYRQFEVPADPNGRRCQLACEGDQSCRAWTYVRPGYVGGSAVCYLKNRITRPQRKPCCISGVVR